MPASTKVRRIGGPRKFLGSRQELNNDGTPYGDPQLYYYSDGGYEVVKSLSHPGPPYKSGGPFLLNRKFVEYKPGPLRTLRTFSNERSCVSIDPLMGTEVNVDAPTFMDMSIHQNDLASFGATGIARFRPGKPIAGAGQFLVELRDLPKIPLNLKRRLQDFLAVPWHDLRIDIRNLGKPGGLTKASSGVSSEYLNLVFGWKPFIKDLQEMYNLQQKIDDAILKIRKQNGRWVKRGGTLLSEKNTAVLDPGTPGFHTTLTLDWFNDYFSSSGVRTTTEETLEKRYWFSGEFRYWIPPETIHSDQWTKKAKAQLFGLDPTPSLLYQVIPWSWLVDWFSNVGDVIDNLSNGYADNLAMRNTYVMGHTRRTVKRVTKYNQWGVKDGFYTDLGLSSTSSTLVEEIKERIPASPFGFGLQLGDLTPRQLSILAALGISRVW